MHDQHPPMSTLRAQANGHIDKMARFFEDAGASHVVEAKKVWKSLLGEALWRDTLVHSANLRSEAVRSGRAQTGWYFEDHPEGRLIIITVAPARGDDLVIREFPDGDYVRFIEPYREQLRGVDNCHVRDMVHWSFLWDERGQDLSLYYQWCVSRLLRSLDADGQALPLIIPEDLVERDLFVAHVERSIRDEISSYLNEQR